MKKKIINAIDIHVGGGLTYLFLLHSYMDSEENIILLDNRAKHKIPKFKKAKSIFFKKGAFRNIRILIFRWNFYISLFTYKNNKFNIDDFIEIYLNGIPPCFRFYYSKVKVYIFIQNRLFFEKKVNNLNSFINAKIYLRIFISKVFLNLFLRNNDVLVSQTNTMKKVLLNAFKFNKVINQEKLWGDFKFNRVENTIRNIQLIDINLINFIRNLSKENILLFYPADFYEHKNHINLIEALNLLNQDKIKKFKLILTINDSDISSISNKNFENIILIGRLQYIDILQIYKIVDYLIFPSYIESYGLPLLEAKYNDLKIISSQMNYVYDVCHPFKVFDPFDKLDMSNIIYSILKK